MGEEQGEETKNEGGDDMEEQETESGSWLKWVIVGIVMLAIVAGGSWWGYRIYEENLREKQAQERYERYKKIKNDPEYNPGYAGISVVKNMEKALELDPDNLEIRLELIGIYDERQGHFANQERKMKKRFKEGMNYLEGWTPTQRQEFLRRVAYNFPEMLGEQDSTGAVKKAVKEAPLTDWAVKRRLGYTSSKAKRSTEDALSYLEKTREIVKKHAEMKDYDPEKKLLYLDYLEGVYWKKKGENGKAADIFVRLYDTGGVWKVDNSDLKKIALPILEKKKRWKDIKRIIENFGARKSVFDFDDLKSESWSPYRKKVFLKTNEGQLWKQAKEKLGEEIPWEEVK